MNLLEETTHFSEGTTYHYFTLTERGRELTPRELSSMVNLSDERNRPFIRKVGEIMIKPNNPRAWVKGTVNKERVENLRERGYRIIS